MRLFLTFYIFKVLQNKGHTSGSSPTKLTTNEAQFIVSELLKRGL